VIGPLGLETTNSSSVTVFFCVCCGHDSRGPNEAKTETFLVKSDNLARNLVEAGQQCKEPLLQISF
jgi:hypothetical protein